MDESIVKHLDASPKVLKLSEAIRIGAKIRPQGTQLLYFNGKSCALGAAAEARGWIANAFESGTRHKFLSDVSDLLFKEIGDRNDSGDSREQIADWLESKGH